MDVTQIYSIVNDAAQQSMGQTAVAVQDLQGLISLGNSIISSQNNSELFLNSLAQRIGKTIFSYRQYENMFSDMVLDDFAWGAIMQKIKISMPEAEADEQYSLVNGKAVDHYKVNKPVVRQKLFITETPLQWHITIQRSLLREAFLSETAMGSFIGYIFGEVQNAMELALENLGHLCLANFAAETTHEIKLVTNYNAATTSTLTASDCIYDEKFLRYAVAQIKQYSKNMRSMSTAYNDGSETRHTPFADQKLRILSSFQTTLETQVQYAAFNEKFVSLDGFTEVNYWQGEQTPDKIIVKRASDGTETTINNVVGFLHDRDALGIFKKTEDVLTTPVNAAAAYYNTYWHEKQLWFNDLSENFVMFTLN